MEQREKTLQNDEQIFILEKEKAMHELSNKVKAVHELVKTVMFLHRDDVHSLSQEEKKGHSNAFSFDVNISKNINESQLTQKFKDSDDEHEEEGHSKRQSQLSSVEK